MKTFFALGQIYQHLPRPGYHDQTTHTSDDGLISTHRPTASACHLSIFSAMSKLSTPSASLTLSLSVSGGAGLAVGTGGAGVALLPYGSFIAMPLNLAKADVADDVAEAAESELPDAAVS